MLLLGYGIAVPTASLGHPPLVASPAPGTVLQLVLGLVQPSHAQCLTSPMWEREPLAGLCGQPLGGRLKAAGLSLGTRRCQSWSRSPLEALTDLVVR